MPIYLVNDAQNQVAAELSAWLSDAAGGELARIERALTLPADCMAMEVDRLRFTANCPGTYQLVLALRAGGAPLLEQSYEIVVQPAPLP